MGFFDRFKQNKSEKIIEHLEYKNSQKKIRRPYYNELKENISNKKITTTEELDILIELGFDDSANSFAKNFIELYNITNMAEDKTCYPLYFLMRKWYKKIRDDKNFFYAGAIYNGWDELYPANQRPPILDSEYLKNRDDEPKSGHKIIDAWFVTEYVKVEKLCLLKKYKNGEIDGFAYKFNIDFLDDKRNKTLNSLNLHSEEEILVMFDTGDIENYK